MSMRNDSFGVGMARMELETLGVLLYTPDGSMCAWRGRQPGQTHGRAAWRPSVTYKSCPIATFDRLSQRTLQRKQSAGADHSHRKV